MGDLLGQARALLEDLTPLNHDCGALCGRACCLPDEDGQGGVWLMPGEEQALSRAPWARVVPGDVPLLMCQGACDRRLRPFLCRLFPLVGVRKGGQWQVRLDQRAWPVCPLMGSGLRALNPAFVDAAGSALRLLARDPACEKLLIRWARIERQYRAQNILEAGNGAD